MSKQARLDQIAAEIITNNVCPDLAKQASQLVMGDGNSDARIVLIGEAPGKKEDQTGKPFMGASGKFLNEMLAAADLQRSEVYITNIVKYRPPSNRDPKVTEKQAFMPYLYAQLEVIQPVLVVTLGRHSMNCFLPDAQIGDVHGQVQMIRMSSTGRVGGLDSDGMQGDDEKRASRTYSTTRESRRKSTQQSAEMLDRQLGFAKAQDEQVLALLPLYHPAAALYNGGLRQTLLDDFSTIPTLLKKLTI